MQVDEVKNETTATVVKGYIDHFFEVYSGRIDFIRGLPEENNFEKVLLSCCYLDSLGLYYAEANGLGTGNQERFMGFVLLAQHKYPELENVWLLGLKLKLKEQGQLALATFLSNNWPLDIRDFSRLDHNPDASWLEFERRVHQDLTGDQPEVMVRTASGFKYAKIIWDQYRNPAVHEGRFKHPWDLRKGKTPFTSTPQIIDVENGREVRYTEVQLGIPSEFLVGCLAESFRLFHSGTTSSEQKARELYVAMRRVDGETPFLFRTGPMFP